MNFKFYALRVAVFVLAAVLSMLSIRGAEIKTDYLSIPAIQTQQIASGLQNPIFVAHANDNRLFVAEQHGKIRIVENGNLLVTPFLDIESLTVCCGELGFLGFAFHPDYATNRYFYLHFTSRGAVLPDNTAPPAGRQLIVRYQTSTANPNVADPASGKLLLAMEQPFQNHAGGIIAFGVDGFLYIARGDGGDQFDPGNRAQNINLLNGKILRIDVNQNQHTAPFYGVPPTNPFINAPGADEVLLIGFRNPWRFSFDRVTGDIWIGDVGQGASEEISRLPTNQNAAGKNFGWRVYEGSFCTNLDPCSLPANYVAPIVEYAHTNGRCSVTGGYVYRGAQIPSLIGAYIYADFCTGEIFALRNNAPIVLLDTSHNISSFGEDANGELYVAALGGAVYKIQPAANAEISGRITNLNNRGLANVRLTLTGKNLSSPRVVQTNPFGYYRFANVPIGFDYVLTPASKRRNLTPANQTLNLTGHLENINFVGN